MPSTLCGYKSIGSVRFSMTNTHGRRRRGARLWSPQGGPKRSPPASPTIGVSHGHADKFAGSKWGEAPSPTCLPLPPTHWMARGCEALQERSLALKLLLQVA